MFVLNLMTPTLEVRVFVGLKVDTTSVGNGKNGLKKKKVVKRDA